MRPQTILLPGDNPAEFDARRKELTKHFAPKNFTEIRFVREMADADWRLQRLRAQLENALTRQIAILAERHPAASPIELQSRAIETLGETGTSHTTWLRCETKLQRQYDRAYRDWNAYQTARHKASPEMSKAIEQAIFAPIPRANPQQTASNVQFDLSTPGLSNAGLANAGLANAGLANAGLSNRGLSNTALSDDEESRLFEFLANAPCPCGSTEKYARCCGQISQAA